MRSCPRQLAARLPPPRLPTSALAGPALAVLKVMKDAGQSNTPKTARWGRLSGLVDVRFGSKADIEAPGMSALCHKQTWCDLFNHVVGADPATGDYRRVVLAVCGARRTVLPMKIRNRRHCNSSFEPRRGEWQ